MDTLEAEIKLLDQMEKRMMRYWLHDFMPRICQHCGAALATERSLKSHIETRKECKAVGGSKQKKIKQKKKLNI